MASVVDNRETAKTKTERDVRRSMQRDYAIDRERILGCQTGAVVVLDLGNSVWSTAKRKLLGARSRLGGNALHSNLAGAQSSSKPVSGPLSRCGQGVPQF